MKKLTLVFCLVAGGYVANAQKGDVKTVTVSTPTLICKTHQQTLVENLKKYDGVASVKINFANQTTTVKYLGDRCNAEIVKTAIANAGYKADEIDANPDFFKMLPKCCKKQ